MAVLRTVQSRKRGPKVFVYTNGKKQSKAERGKSTKTIGGIYEGYRHRYHVVYY
jgi:hypothetical protein